MAAIKTVISRDGGDRGSLNITNNISTQQKQSPADQTNESINSDYIKLIRQTFNIYFTFLYFLCKD